MKSTEVKSVLGFAFDCKIQNPDFKIWIWITQSNATNVYVFFVCLEKGSTVTSPFPLGWTFNICFLSLFRIKQHSQIQFRSGVTCYMASKSLLFLLLLFSFIYRFLCYFNKPSTLIFTSSNEANMVAWNRNFLGFNIEKT